MKSAKWVAILLGCSTVGLLASCKEKSEPARETCVEFRGVCAGVEAMNLGSSTWYTDGATCANTLYVKEGSSGGNGSQQSPFGDLPEAAAVASAGDCIALAAGDYNSVVLPDSVSVLGRGAASTTVTVANTIPLTILGGQDILVRGLKLTGDGWGIVIKNATNVRVESVSAEGLMAVGAFVENAWQVTLDHFWVSDLRPQEITNVGVGVAAVDATDIRIENTLVERCSGSGVVFRNSDMLLQNTVIRDNEGYGAASSCPDCTTVFPAAVVRSTLVENNEGVGVWLKRVAATVEQVEIRGTRRNKFGLSRSFEAVEIPNLQMSDNNIQAGEDMGIFLHMTSGSMTGNRVSDHGGRGIWMQQCDNPAQCPDPLTFHISQTEVTGNQEVGVGVNGDCQVTIDGGQISNTVLKDVIIDNKGEHVGDGLQILTDSTVEITGATLDANGRVQVLVDGAFSFKVENSVVTGAIERAIVVQNMTGWDPGESVRNNTDGVGGTVGHTEPSDPFGWDPGEIPVSWDPGESVAPF
jgi:hypothetical protein